jgi:hypothetical protein
MRLFVTLTIVRSNLIPRPKLTEEIEYATLGGDDWLDDKLTAKSDVVPVKVAEYDTE